jgi:hypothetical protein
MGLAQAGVSQGELIRMVSAAEEIDFDLRPVATDAMMKAGVSGNVIRAMAARESGIATTITAMARALFAEDNTICYTGLRSVG